MEVYLITGVVSECWDGDVLNTMGVFSTEQKAINFCKKKFKDKKDHWDKMYIESFELDTGLFTGASTFIRGRVYENRIE